MTVTTTTLRKVLFVTGTRADFGKLKPLMTKIRDCGDFDYDIFITGMHMLSRYGHTYLEIPKSGFDNYFLHINQHDAADHQMDMVLAHTVLGLGNYIREFPPDLLVIHGDRIEALAGAIVGSLNNILVAHIEGGEVSGTIDELIRHAVSKLSHLHFVANEEAQQRLRQMGEVAESIFVIGSPDIDIMLSDSLPTLKETQNRYDLPFNEYGILLYHPVTTELPRLEHNIRTVVDALISSGRNYVVIDPNNDHGSEIVRTELNRLRENQRFCQRTSMRFEHFLTLLKNAQVIVGNSSAGVREAPAYGVPTINVGSRQKNRYHYPSILNTTEELDEILDALNRLPARVTPSRHFGNGTSAKLFLRELSAQSFWETPRQKHFCDLPVMPLSIPSSPNGRDS